MEGFTAAQACSYTGCTPHQLRYWDRIKLVQPGIQSTGGRPGVRRLYSFRDLVALKVVASLLDKGLSLQRIRRAYDYLRRRAALDQHLSDVSLVTDGNSIFQMYKNDGELIDLLKEGQLAFYLVLDSAADSEAGRKAGHLYDREDFVKVLRDSEAELSKELPPPARERAYRAKAV